MRAIAGDRPPRYGETEAVARLTRFTAYPQAIPNYSLLKVRRTLMSIARAGSQVLKVRRTLMFPATLRVLQIKDLKDLSIFSVRVSINMQDLKDLKRFFHGCYRGGQAPALR